MQNINWQLATAQKVQFLRQSASYNEKDLIRVVQHLFHFYRTSPPVNLSEASDWFERATTTVKNKNTTSILY